MLLLKMVDRKLPPEKLLPGRILAILILKQTLNLIQGGGNLLVGERRQLGIVKLDGNLDVSGWVGLAYDR